MAKRVCYCLIPRSPFHFGERGVGMEETSVILHADTLFSALCITLAQIGGDLDGLLAKFTRGRFAGGKSPEIIPGMAPFLLSSAFPFWARRKKYVFEEPIFLFPKPFLRLQYTSSMDDPRWSKLLKKVEFISKPIFESMLKGLPVDFAEDRLIQDKKIWLMPEEKTRIGTERIWVEDTQPHVAVDRMSSASQPYAVGQVRFEKQAGLFFLVDYNEPEWRPIVEKTLRVLGDNGIGGERSSGKGQFALYTVEDFSLITPSNTNAYTTLALYWPVQQEVQTGILSEASYGLIQRRGWVGTPGNLNLRRRGVRMLTEGSVFSKKPEGALADVKPLDPEEVPNVPHDIWRYGLAFPIPCQIMKEG